MPADPEWDTILPHPIDFVLKGRLWICRWRRLRVIWNLEIAIAIALSLDSGQPFGLDEALVNRADYRGGTLPPGPGSVTGARDVPWIVRFE